MTADLSDRIRIAIMNLPTKTPAHVNGYGDYELGHKNARHSAAELVVQMLAEAEQPDPNAVVVRIAVGVRQIGGRTIAATLAVDDNDTEQEARDYAHSEFDTNQAMVTATIPPVAKVPTVAGSVEVPK